MEQKNYKFVGKQGSKLFSLFTMRIPELKVEYFKDQWSEAPVGGLFTLGPDTLEEGYRMIIPSIFHALITYRSADVPVDGLELWEVEGEELIPVPQKLPMGWGLVSGDKSFDDAIKGWKHEPECWTYPTQRCYRRVKLVSRIYEYTMPEWWPDLCGREREEAENFIQVFLHHTSR